MMDLVYLSRAIRFDREREARKHQFVSRVQRLLRQPPPMRRDAVRTLLLQKGRRGAPAAWCCTFGASA